MCLATGKRLVGIMACVSLSGCLNPEASRYLDPPAPQPVTGPVSVFVAPEAQLGLAAGLIESAHLAEAARNYNGAIGALKSARDELSKQSGQDAKLAEVIAKLDQDISRLTQLAERGPVPVTADDLLNKAKAVVSPAPTGSANL